MRQGKFRAANPCFTRLMLSHTDTHSDKRHSPEDGATPLYVAARNNQSAVVSVLLRWPGIAVDAATATGATALTIAARQGHIDVIRLLLPLPPVLGSEPVVIKRSSDLGTDASSTTAKTPRANVNWEEHDGWTALLIACLQRSEEVVRHLVRAGADKTHVTKSGVSLASAVTRVRIQSSES